MSKIAMERANIRFNYKDYLLLPEDKRYEILDGDLYMVPAPDTKHQLVCGELHFALLKHIKEKGLGRLFISPYDLVLSDENIVQPDLLFLSKERTGLIGELNLRGAPDLVVEILSPGTRDRDLEIKWKIYARFGVREYWIVDPEAETVEVLVLSGQRYKSAGIYARSDRLSSPLLPDLAIPLAEIFPIPNR